MNSCIRRLIAIKAFRNLKEGKIMNNYKINNEVSEKLMSSFDIANQEEEIIRFNNKLQALIKKLHLGDLYNGSNLISVYDGKNIIINNLDAFDNEQIDYYSELDRDLTHLLEAVQFELNSLNMQKQSALDSFNIAQAVKLNDKINALKEKQASNHLKITKYNKEIADIEQEFVESYEKMLSKTKKIDVDRLKELEKIYGVGVVKFYKKNQLFKGIDEMLSVFDQDTKTKILENNQFKSILGDLNDEFIEGQKNVGANNKSGDK